MPSPFPGMDPWLEDPGVWPGFHTYLVTSTVTVLQPQLRARGYFIDANERIWMSEPRRPVYPDNVILQRSRGPSAGNGGTTTLVADEPLIVKRAGLEVRETYAEIFETETRRLVTGIEFISPTNKSDHQGRELYQKKQAEMRDSDLHLVEVDFIRRGRPVVDVSEEYLQSLARWDYIANIGRRFSTDYEFYAIRLRDRLPRIAIPLRTGDNDAVLDLQDVFNRAYDTGPYPDRLDYTREPLTPLAEDDSLWADDILKRAGVRQ